MPRTRFEGIKGLVSAARNPNQRAQAKKKDPNNKAVLIFVRRDLHHRAKLELTDTGKDFSDLVNDMLVDWLKSAKSAKPTKPD